MPLSTQLLSLPFLAHCLNFGAWDDDTLTPRLAHFFFPSFFAFPPPTLRMHSPLPRWSDRGVCRVRRPLFVPDARNWHPSPPGPPVVCAGR